MENNKVIIYNKLNELLELIESGNIHEAKIELEGFINEIKYGIYG